MNQMNSQNIAQGLAALGRGNDSMLMHVTPREVYGLQSLAMAAGGSLSVNPHTGLPEAGFFDFLGNMLPQIAGTAIGVATGNPYIGAAVAGAGETAKSGNLMSGIMAGLGAYGGANLFQGVANAAPGAASATGAGASTANLPSATQLGSSATQPNKPVKHLWLAWLEVLPTCRLRVLHFNLSQPLTQWVLLEP
jgi:hypothetical protein